MFTGIIEAVGEITTIREEGTNLHFTISSTISKELKIDQSVAHNGVCLTVVELEGDAHTVTAIKETLDKTSLAAWKIGSSVNLERAMLADSRFDGHMVQGHVDTTAEVVKVNEVDGSWEYYFKFIPTDVSMLVDKGSICIDGVSLTVVQATMDSFSVAIIPYTYEHTCFKYLKEGHKVNLEFDILGKYLSKYFAGIASKLQA